MGSWTEITGQWLLDSAPLGIMTTDARLTIISWNRWLENVSRQSADYMVGRNLLEAFPDLVDRRMVRYYQQALQGKAKMLSQRSHGYLLPLESSRGPKGKGLSYMQQKAQIAPLMQNRQITGTITLIEDVTQRIKRETELLESEERYRILAEHVQVGVYVLQGSQVRYINPAFRRIIGYPEGRSPLRLELLSFIFPEDRQRFTELIHLLMSGKLDSSQEEIRVVQPDGSIRYVDGYYIPVAYDEQPAILGAALDVTQRKQAEEQIQRQLQYLNALRAIDQAITGIFDLEVVLNLLLDQVIARLHVDAADILTFDPATKILTCACGRGVHGAAVQKIHEILANAAVRKRSIISIADARQAILPEESDRFQELPIDPHDIITSAGFTAYYCVPLIAKGQVKGVLEVLHRSPLEAAPEWLLFLEALANQAAIAIDNLSLFENLQRSNLELAMAYDTTLEGWSRAMDLRDKETEGHSRRVTDMSLLVARAMGCTDPELKQMRRGALLHDIGKMGIPDSILLKAGPLDPEEWAIMRQHPELAYQLLSPIVFLQPALAIPYCHHEKWDGTGYPRGLKGEEIPLEARIFAVVDVWDSLRSHRPYRACWPADNALEFIREQSGQHFDPRVVEVFLSLIQGQFDEGQPLTPDEAIDNIK